MKEKQKVIYELLLRMKEEEMQFNYIRRDSDSDELVVIFTHGVIDEIKFILNEKKECIRIEQFNFAFDDTIRDTRIVSKINNPDIWHLFESFWGEYKEHFKLRLKALMA